LLLQRCHALSVGLFEVLPKRGHPLGCGLGPLCGSLREFRTHCDPHSGPRRAERAQETLCQPAEGLRGDIKGRSPLAGWAESNDWVRDHEPLLFWTAALWFPCLFGHTQLCSLSARAVGCGPRRPPLSQGASSYGAAHSLPRGRDRGDCVRGTGRDKRDQLDGLPRRFGMRSQVGLAPMISP
jgi:hypothetical protein